MHPITLSSTYQVHPEAPTSVYARCAAMFSSAFPSDGFINELTDIKRSLTSAALNSGGRSTDCALDAHSACSAMLSRVLSNFNGQRNVGDVIVHLPLDLKTVAVDIVIWLLRWRIIMEIRTYLVRTECEDDELEAFERKLDVMSDEQSALTKGGNSNSKLASPNLGRGRRSSTPRPDGVSPAPLTVTPTRSAILDKLAKYVGTTADLFEIGWKLGLDEATILEALNGHPALTAVKV
jgi:hypothetical protein